VFYLGFAKETAKGCFLISHVSEGDIILHHEQNAARESRVERALLRENRYEKLDFREYLTLGFRRRSEVRCTLQMPLHRGTSLLYEQRHFTNVFTGASGSFGFHLVGTFRKKKYPSSLNP
jgi:hypothetical protein